MDPISQFQQQLSAPIYAFLGQFWPIVVFAVLAIAGFFFLPENMKEDRAAFDLSLNDTTDSDGDGGAGD